MCFGLARECVSTLFFFFPVLCLVCEKCDGAVSGGYRQPVWISKEERCASLCSRALTRSSLQICPLYFTDRKNPELLPNILSVCLYFKKNKQKKIHLRAAFRSCLSFSFVQLNHMHSHVHSWVHTLGGCSLLIGWRVSINF